MTAELSIYGDIGTKEGEISATAIKAAIDSLAEQSHPPLIVDIHTRGGDVVEGMEIYRLLRAYPNHVTTRCVNAISIGSVIALAGDTRIMAENGRIMIHEAQGAPAGTVKNIRKSADLIETLESEMVAVYMDRTGLGEEDVRAMMAEETWFTAAEAHQFGFITETSEPVALAAQMDLSQYKNFSAASVGADLSEDQPQKEGDPVSVSVKELKKAFPKASSDFIVKAMEEEKTMEETTAMYVKNMEEENEELKAELEEVKAELDEMKAKVAAMEEPEVEAMEEEEEAPVTARKTAKVVAGVSGGKPTKPAAEVWRAKVDKIVASGKPRHQAVKLAASRFPELRARLVEEANPHLS